MVINSVNDLSKLVAFLRTNFKAGLKFAGLTEDEILAMLQEAAKRVSRDLEVVMPDGERVLRFMKTGAVIGAITGYAVGGVPGAVVGGVLGCAVGAGAACIRLNLEDNCLKRS